MRENAVIDYKSAITITIIHTPVSGSGNCNSPKLAPLFCKGLFPQRIRKPVANILGTVDSFFPVYIKVLGNYLDI